LKNSRYRFQNFRDVDKILDTRQEILDEIQDIHSQIVYYHTQQQRIANKIGMSQNSLYVFKEFLQQLKYCRYPSLPKVQGQ